MKRILYYTAILFLLVGVVFLIHHRIATERGKTIDEHFEVLDTYSVASSKLLNVTVVKVVRYLPTGDCFLVGGRGSSSFATSISCPSVNEVDQIK